MDKLSFKEKVSQLFIYTIAPVDTKQNLDLLREVIDTYKVGGLLFSGGKMQKQVELTNRAQRQAKVPLMITFDGEWGLSMRLHGTPVFPRKMVLGCIRDNRLLYEYGREVARQCRQIGVQVNFAPVADVNINPKNPVINTRSFGEDPIQVADKVIAYAYGLEGGGVLSVCKHFPGHGDTVEDSHKASAHVYKTKEELYAKELQPFLAGITANADFVMMGHLNVDCLDSQNPASLSPIIIQETLRHDLGFDGIVITDALQMSAIANNYTPEEVAIKAVIAGNDMLLEPVDIAKTISARENAVSQGTIPEERINESVRKILIQKITWMGK